MDFNVLFDKLVNEYGPWAVVIVGMYLLYRQNLNLYDQIRIMSDKYIELAIKNSDTSVKHSGYIQRLAERQKELVEFIRRGND